MQTDSTPTSTPGSPHTGWWAAAEELVADMRREPAQEDPEQNWCGDRADELYRMIGARPATSLEAILCQLKVALAALRGETAAEYGEVALERAISALEAEAGRVP
ncbi:MAG: hypothetical protein AB7I59_05495 [Geminicoccaceae bacterium]